MKKLLLVAGVLLLAPLAFGQTLSPIVEGHVLRSQTVQEQISNGARSCSRPNNCVETFVYFDRVYVGGQNSYVDNPNGDNFRTVFWRDSRPIYEFDISSLPTSFTATLEVQNLELWFGGNPATPLAITAYRSSASDANGVLTNCDFNPAGGGFDGNRFLTTGCSNLSAGPIAATASLSTSAFPQTASLDVTAAVAAAKTAGQTRVGFALGANQSAPPASDTNFDGDELRLGTAGSGARLIIGTGTTPTLQVTANACTSTTVGTSSTTAVTIRNTGGGTLTISEVVEISDTSGFFTLDTTGMATSLAGGASTTINVVYAPTAAGNHDFVLEVRSNAGSRQAELNCSATEVAKEEIAVSPESTTCGPLAAGSTQTTPVTITNSGTATLTGISVTAEASSSPAFVLNTTGLATSLAPGATTTFTVTFTAPNSAGTHTATYRVASSDSARPTVLVSFACQSVPTCDNPTDPQTINVQTQADACEPPQVGGSSSTIVAVQNIGGQELSIASITEVSDGAGMFHADTTGFDTSLQCRQQSSFRVIFTPTRSGAFAATYRIASNDPQRPTVDIVVACSTTGTSLQSVDVSDLVDGAADRSRFVAAAAKAPGAEGTFWLTDLKVENTGQEDADVRVVYLEAGNATNVTAPGATFRIAGGATLALYDVVGAGLFGESSSAGAILVAPIEPVATTLIVSSRTYNRAETGTYGQFIPGQSAEGALTRALAGQVLLGIAENEGFRTNVGAANLGDTSATVRVVLRSGTDGSAIGNPVLIDLGPFGQKQVHQIVKAAGVNSATNVYADVTLESGEAILAYASIVDNKSGDPIFVPATE